MSYNSIDRALENEIRIIEEDDSLTPQEKAKEISKLEREARASVYSRCEIEVNKFYF